MKLSMWNIYHGLAEEHKLAMIHDGEATITGARWLITTKLSPDHVYVGGAGEYFDAGDEDAIIVHRRDMILVNQTDPEELFDEVCSIIERFNIWQQRLMDLMDSENGLQRMIDLSRSLLQNPSFVYSPTGEILAMASDYPASVHWHWKELIDNRGLSEKRLKYLKDNIQLSAVFEDTVPVRRNSVMDNYEYIHCSIFQKKRIVGHFVLFGFSASIPEGMEIIIHELVSRMNRYTESHYLEFSPQSKLTDVFLGYLQKEPYDKEILTELLQSLHWQLEDLYQIFVIRETVSSEPVLLTRICRKINQEVPSVLAAVRDERLTILRNLSVGGPEKSQEELDRLKEILGDDFYIGASTPFRKFELSEIYYRQGRAELDRCERDGLKWSSGDLHLLDSLREVIRSNDLLETYVDPALWRLYIYDRNNGTSWYATFRAYCISGFHKSETASFLSLHRNTLNYRLERIAELLGQDVFYRLTQPGDLSKLMSLIISCFILDCFEAE